MKRIVAAVITIALALSAFLPSTAQAMPASWKGSEIVTKAGVTYRLRKSDHVAAVVRVRKAKATIPAEVKHKGRWYEVRAIWDGAIPKSQKSLTIHADLECCEDADLWRVPKVMVTRKGMHRWLKRTGANVSKISCKGCE